MKIKRIWDLYQHLIMAYFYKVTSIFSCIIEVDDNTKVPKKALIKKVIMEYLKLNSKEFLNFVIYMQIYR